MVFWLAEESLAPYSMHSHQQSIVLARANSTHLHQHYETFIYIKYTTEMNEYKSSQVYNGLVYHCPRLFLQYISTGSTKSVTEL